MAKAAIYCRISSDREGEEVGVENQEEICKKLAATLDLTVEPAHLYRDNDISASTLSKKHRPGFEAMLDAARRGEFGTIIAYSNSRLTRRPLEVEELIRLHEHYAVRVRTVVSGDDNLGTADGRMVARIKGNVDAAEAERTSERVRLAQAARLTKGLDGGGPRPFGFEKDRSTIREHEAQALKLAYSMILEGKSIYSIAKKFDELGIRRDRAPEGQWQTQTIRHILLRERNCGRLVVKGVKYSDDLPQIIDPETFDAVKAILLSNKRPERRGPKQTALAAVGAVKCGVCGGELSQTGTRRHGGRAVRCTPTSRPRATLGTRHPTMAVGAIDRDLALNVLWQVVFRSLAGEKVKASESPVKALRLKVAALTQQRDDEQDLYSIPGSNKAKIAASITRLGAEIDEAQAELDRALAADVGSSAVAAASEVIRRFQNEEPDEGPINEAAWLDYWKTLDVEDQRQLIQSVLPGARLLKAEERRLDGSRITFEGLSLSEDDSALKEAS